MSDYYEFGIKPALERTGYQSVRIDKEPFTGPIVEQIKREISEAELVIADLTGANPNVYLEVGYAWAMGKPTMFVVQDADEVCFDVRAHKYLEYGEQVSTLKALLENELRGLRLD